MREESILKILYQDNSCSPEDVYNQTSNEPSRCQDAACLLSCIQHLASYDKDVLWAIMQCERR